MEELKDTTTDESSFRKYKSLTAPTQSKKIYHPISEKIFKHTRKQMENCSEIKAKEILGRIKR